MSDIEKYFIENYFNRLWSIKLEAMSLAEKGMEDQIFQPHEVCFTSRNFIAKGMMNLQTSFKIVNSCYTDTEIEVVINIYESKLIEEFNQWFLQRFK